MKSMYLALVALIMAALALINSVCEFRDSNLIISFLGVLVTLLVGWNIIQFIFAEKTMKSIAQKASNEIALNVVSALEIGKMLEVANSQRRFKKYMDSIDKYFNAIQHILSLSEPEIRQYEIGVAAQGLKDVLSRCQGKVGKVWILPEKRFYYETLLKSLPEPFLSQCASLLLSAEEHQAEDDDKFWDGGIEL